MTSREHSVGRAHCLAFTIDPVLQEEVKIGILIGFFLTEIAGWAILRVAPRATPAPKHYVRAHDSLSGPCLTVRERQEQ